MYFKLFKFCVRYLDSEYFLVVKLFFFSVKFGVWLNRVVTALAGKARSFLPFSYVRNVEVYSDLNIERKVDMNV